MVCKQYIILNHMLSEKTTSFPKNFPNSWWIFTYDPPNWSLEPSLQEVEIVANNVLAVVMGLKMAKKVPKIAYVSVRPLIGIKTLRQFISIL